MSDITTIPFDFIVKHTKTENIVSKDEQGDYVCDIETEHIPLVRCKECKHWTGETEHYEDREYKACWQLCGQYVNSEFWCKYGEREGE